MKCEICGSDRIAILNKQTEAITRTKHTGILWKLGRLTMIVCTGGLWLMIGKRKEKGKTKYKNKTVAICNNCGHKWEV